MCANAHILELHCEFLLISSWTLELQWIGGNARTFLKSCMMEMPSWLTTSYIQEVERASEPAPTITNAPFLPTTTIMMRGSVFLQQTDISLH